MAKDSEAFFSSGSPSAKFEMPGTTVTGTITEEPVMQQQTTPEGKLKTWDDGSPMNQLVVALQTTQRDPEIEDDDGVRRLYVKGQMRTAIQTALREAGTKGLDVGGTLTVTYTHDGERTNPAFSPPKQYVASYVKPSADQAGFFGTGQLVGSGGNGVAANPAAAVAAPPVALPAGMTPEVWATLPDAAKAALMATQAPAAEVLPPGMTPEVWAGLTDEAKAALRGLVGK